MRGGQQRAGRPRRLSAVVVGVFIAWHPTAVQAHKAPLPLALWGGFAATESHCQRAIAFAASWCATDAWLTRARCLSAELAGTPCDGSAITAGIQQLHSAATDFAEERCGDADLAQLGTSSPEIDFDLNSVCQQLDDALWSAVYLPARHGVTLVAVDDATRSCIAVTARTVTTLLHYAFRERRRLLDTIAHRALPPTKKLPLVQQSTARIERVRIALGQRVETTCPDFMSIYGRHVDTLLTGIAQRGDCLGGAAYVQDAVVCPMPTCGNGMIEGREQCDDGNLIDGDGCHGDCTIESPSVSASRVWRSQ